MSTLNNLLITACFVAVPILLVVVFYRLAHILQNDRTVNITLLILWGVLTMIFIEGIMWVWGLPVPEAILVVPPSTTSPLEGGGL